MHTHIYLLTYFPRTHMGLELWLLPVAHWLLHWCARDSETTGRGGSVGGQGLVTLIHWHRCIATLNMYCIHQQQGPEQYSKSDAKRTRAPSQSRHKTESSKQRQDFGPNNLLFCQYIIHDFSAMFPKTDPLRLGRARS